jgi:hypothetical protein
MVDSVRKHTKNTEAAKATIASHAIERSKRLCVVEYLHKRRYVTRCRPQGICDAHHHALAVVHERD